MTRRYRLFQAVKAWKVLCCLILVLNFLNGCFFGTDSKVTKLSKGVFDGLSTRMPAERYLAQMLPDLAYGPLPDEKLDLWWRVGVG